MQEIKKRTTPWKDGKVLSIRLKNGVYVLAQMVTEPYLVCFNLFTKDNDWQNVRLAEEHILFCHAVTRQFIKCSPVTVIKNVQPLTDYKLPTKWIYAGLGSRSRIVTVNGKQREVRIPASYHSLVERDLEDHKNNHILGLFKKILIDNLTLEDWKEIKDVEDMSIDIYPNLNERLFLCYLAGKNVNPSVEIDIGKEIPDSYETYIDIISGVVPLKDLGY